MYSRMSPRATLQALAHLPLTAEFKLCEVDLSQMLPESALAPFRAELSQRSKRRLKRAATERRAIAREAATTAAEQKPFELTAKVCRRPCVPLVSAALPSVAALSAAVLHFRMGLCHIACATSYLCGNNTGIFHG